METPRAQMERELADLRSRDTAYVRSATRMRMLIMLSGTVSLPA